MSTDRVGAVDLGSLAEGIVDLHGAHQTQPIWKGQHAAEDTCGHCGHTWPCPTVCLVLDALGAERPEPKITGCVWFNEETGAEWTSDWIGSFIMCGHPRGHDGPHEGHTTIRASAP